MTKLEKKAVRVMWLCKPAVWAVLVPRDSARTYSKKADAVRIARQHAKAEGRPVHIGKKPKKLPAPQLFQWSSVSKRCPPHDGKKDSLGTAVLVWPYFHGNYEGEPPVVMAAYYGRRVTNRPSFYLYGAVLGSITHWMLPPEPPR